MSQLSFIKAKKPSISEAILEYLKRNHYLWVNGGDLERKIADSTGCKPSTVGRILRDMEEHDTIYKQQPKKSVEYKYREL